MDELTDDHRENVTYISQAGRHLLDLINEVLDISRMESGQMTISREPVAVADVLHEVAALVTPLADRRRSRWSQSRMTEVPTCWPIDSASQVLLNLLSNAMKYNRDGGTVRIAAATASPATG